MPKNQNVKRVMVIGSGPIVIGQAAEFDYAGTQACRSLKEEGVEEVSYESFDHNLHMAVQTVPADDEHPADSIVQVFQKGYQLHERLLRPAMVVVAQ